VKPGNVLHLYRVRVRARLVQELFAVVGIAAGVALLFASQVASQSLSSSVAQLSHGIVGNATLQLLARDPHGMPEALVRQVRGISGVRAAAPLLEASAQATGPRGGESVELVGADSSLRDLGGALVRHTELEPFAGIGAVLLPAPLATHLGVTKFGREVTLKLYGRTERAPLYEELHERQIGGLVASPIVVAPLFFAQEMAGLAGRVSRVLVQPAPGREAAVRAGLLRLAAGRLNVESTSYDETLFAKAASASNQSTALFAVISALVGFLFAFNAMLLTVPQRRRLIADLRRDGYTPRTVVCVLLLDAVVLGLAACMLGLVLGEELSIHLFRSNPGYLGSAFAVGTQRVVGSRSVAIAAGGGMLAAVVAVLSPLRDILSRDPLAAIAPKEGSAAGHASIGTALGGAVCLAAATAILLAIPKDAILGMILLVGALLLVLPAALDLALALLTRLARQLTGAVPHVAAMELSAARARAIAVAATAAARRRAGWVTRRRGGERTARPRASRREMRSDEA
jgi:putative ABC transport system permease protein